MCHLVSAVEEDVAAAYKTVRHELDAYSGGIITGKPEIVALSQVDILDPETRRAKVMALKKASGKTPFEISAVTNEGMTGVLRALRDIIVDAKTETDDLGEDYVPDRYDPETGHLDE